MDDLTDTRHLPTIAGAIRYTLSRWNGLTRFLDDGRIEIDSNAGSERGADRAAAMTTLIMTAKLKDVDPQSWLTDVLGQIADIPQGRLAELLP